MDIGAAPPIIGDDWCTMGSPASAMKISLSVESSPWSSGVVGWL